MTLAVVATWPFGRWAEIFQSAPMPIILEQAVIVATDSRFTLSDGRGVDDAGRKLYLFRDLAAMVFAGDVMAAEDTYRSLARLLTRRQLNYTSFGRLLPLYLRSAHASERRRRTQDKIGSPHPLHVLVGTLDGHGRAATLRSSSIDKNFRVSISAGVDAIGGRKDVGLFRKYLDEADEEHMNQNSSLGTTDQIYRTFMILILDAMQRVIDSPEQSGSVGGRLQSVLITKQGMRSYSVHQLGPSILDDGMPAQREITIPLVQVRPYGRERRRKSIAAAADLVMAHVAD